MTIALPTPFETFCGRHGVLPPFELEPIRSGRNSNVQRLRNRDNQWIVKDYFQHPNDQRDRLGVEFGFLQFCNRHGVAGVAQAIGMERKLNCALYTLLPGARPIMIDTHHVSQASGFILMLNRLRNANGAKQLPPASEACFSWQSHLHMVARRVERLHEIAPNSSLESAARRFVQDDLTPVWQRLQQELTGSLTLQQLQSELALDARILSPSDFGFHNALEHGQRLAFVDFEYAGWDDPAKLICDFICQPELPVSAEQGRQFRDEMLAGLADDGTLAERITHLLPLHRIKWCCILLNEFRLEDRQRRLHAGLDVDTLLETQLAKAQTYFNTHLA